MGVTSVRLNDELQARLAKLAEDKQRSRGWIINEALEQFVAREELQAERHRQSLETLREVEAGEVVEGKAVLNWIESWGTDDVRPPPQ